MKRIILFTFFLASLCVHSFKADNSGTSLVGPHAPQPQDRLNTAESREREMQWLERRFCCSATARQSATSKFLTHL